MLLIAIVIISWLFSGAGKAQEPEDLRPRAEKSVAGDDDQVSNFITAEHERGGGGESCLPLEQAQKQIKADHRAA